MPKFYTVSQANALLPRLTTLLEEMKSRGQQLAGVQGKQARIRRKVRSNGHHNEAIDAELRKEERPAEHALRTGLEQLVEWNIELKDLQRGLVDFPAQLEGRTVFLCWELGEPEVAYWHETDTGFTDRRPLDSRFA